MVSQAGVRLARIVIPLLVLAAATLAATQASAYLVATGSAGHVMRSPDATTWSAQPLGTTNLLFDVAYGGDKWVAVGNTGTILTSPDAITWTIQSSSGAALRSVAYGKDGSGNPLWVAVGDSATIRSSPNGITWTTQNTGTASLYGVAYNAGKWIAVGTSGTVLSSSVGAGAWTSTPITGVTGNLFGITHAAGKWMLVGQGIIRHSTDGTAWATPTSGVPASGGLRDAAAAGGTWIVAGDTTSVSTDGGDTWTASTAGLAGTPYGVTHTGSQWLIATTSGLFTSPTAGPWTKAVAGTTANMYSAAFGGDRTVAVGSNAAIVVSPDGTTWYHWNSGATVASLSAVVHGGDKWVAVGGSGTVLTSRDGAAWIGRNSGSTQTLNSIAYGNDVFVAVGWSSTILTSPDGISWTARTAPVAGMVLDEVAFGNGAFVIVGGSSTAASITVWVSTDNGATWTVQTSGVGSNNLSAVAYGKDGSDNNLWAIGGAAGVILTSPGGPAWSWSPQVSNIAQQIWGMSYGGGQWLAVGAVTPGNAQANVATSPDGTTWTSRTGIATNPLRASVHDGTRWATVGDQGVIRVTTGPPWTWTSLSAPVLANYMRVANGPTPPVLGALACAPASQTVSVGSSATLAAAGGLAPYTWTAAGSSNPGPVSGASFATTYGATGTYTVKVTDADFPMRTAQCSVTVTPAPPPACAPATQTVVAGETATLTASLGVPPYSWSTTGSSDDGPTPGASYATTYASATGSPFTVTLRDSNSPVGQATCTVVVQPLPLALADSFTTPSGSVFTAPACAAGMPATNGGPYAGVLCNDQDIANHALQAVLVASPTHVAIDGTFSLAPGGKGGFSYQPDSGICGPTADSFQYQLHDATTGEPRNVVAVNLNVPCPGPPVQAVEDAYVLDEDCSAGSATSCATPFVASPLASCTAPTGVLCNDTNTPNHAVEAQLVSGPSHGILLRGDGSGPSPALGADGSFRYTPASNWCGDDSFTYRLRDLTDAVDVNVAVATLTVACVNDPPQALPDSYKIVKDSPLAPLLPAVRDNDVDADAGLPASPPAWGALSVTAVSTPTAGGTAILSGGAVQYKPASGFVGTETFAYTLVDGGAAATSGTVTIQVNPNRAPAASFTVTPAAPRVGEPVFLLDASLDPDDGDAIALWAWEFGDGHASSASSPMHVYQAVGTRTVCLTVRDSFGASSARMCRSIVVAPASAPMAAPTPATSTTAPTSDAAPALPPLQVAAGDDVETHEGAVVALRATVTGAVAPDVTWRQVAGSPISPATGTGTAFTFTAPPGPTTVYLTVTATDGERVAVDHVRIVVAGSGAPPPSLAVAGPATTVAGQAAALTVTVAGAEAGELHIRWRQVEGPSALLAGTDSATLSFTPGDAGTYTFVVEVTAPNGVSVAEHAVVVASAAAIEPPDAGRSAIRDPALKPEPQAPAEPPDGRPVALWGSAALAALAAGVVAVALAARRRLRRPRV